MEGREISFSSLQKIVDNSNLCQFSKCCVHNGCGGIRSMLKLDDEFECNTCTSRERVSKGVPRQGRIIWSIS